MKIGLFFGSFNPIHKGHIGIASYFLEETDLAEIWFVISPQNPLKNEKELLDVEKRLELVHAAIGDIESIKCSEIELAMPVPSFTIDTLNKLKQDFPKNDFVILMGTDNMEKFNLWKNYEAILEHYKIYVYPRTGCNADQFREHPSVTLIDSQLLEVSATMLRDQMREGKFDKWLPSAVAQIIKKKGYYKGER